MTECRCQACSPDPLYSHSEDFKLLCLGRYLLSMPQDELLRYHHDAQCKGMGVRVGEALKRAEVPF